MARCHFLFIICYFFISMLSFAMEQGHEMLTLMSSDREKHVVSLEDMKCSTVIVKLVEDVGIKEPISLSTIDGRILKEMINIISLRRNVNSIFASKVVKNKKELDRAFNIFVISLISTVFSEHNDIEKLFNAANYLDIDFLMSSSGAVLGKWLFTGTWDISDEIFPTTEKKAKLYILTQLFEYADHFDDELVSKCKRLGNGLIIAAINRQALTFKQCLTCIKIIQKDTIKDLKEDYFISKQVKKSLARDTGRNIDALKLGNHSLCRLFVTTKRKYQSANPNLSTKEVLEHVLTEWYGGDQRFARAMIDWLDADFNGSYTGLMLVFRFYDSKTVEFVLKKFKTLAVKTQVVLNKDELNKKSIDDNATALHAAVLSGDIEIAKLVIAELRCLGILNEQLFHKDNYGLTPLMIAVLNKKNVELTELIVSELTTMGKLQDNLLIKDSHGKDLLNLAEKNDDNPAFKYILNVNINPVYL